MRHDPRSMTPGNDIYARIARAREEYHARQFELDDLASTWHEQFDLWFRGAAQAGIPEPNGMVLATADTDGAPSERMVLLRGLDERGLTFHTNRRSTKGMQIAANPRVAALFPWVAIHRQIVVTGTAAQLDDAESDEYWASRPLESRISALASPQSEVVSSRAALEALRDQAAGGDLSRPAHWGGYLITPNAVEFWQGREHRLHDRLRYRLTQDGWLTERLAP
jgi:pyridoxamine 5'-phosphate oxidase